MLFPKGILGKEIERKERSVMCACVLPLEQDQSYEKKLWFCFSTVVRVHRLPRIYISRLSLTKFCTFTFVQNSFQAVGN